MHIAIPNRTDVLRVAETFLVGSIGGSLFYWIHFPGGFTSGAMIAVAIAGMAGRPMRMPVAFIQPTLLILGVSIGGVVSREFLSNIGAYPITLALLTVATVCVTWSGATYLQHVHRWDRTSAFLAASPGALSQIVTLAEEKHADVAGVAVVQTLRIVMLTAVLPLALALLGIAPTAATLVRGTVAGPLALAALVVAALVMSLLLHSIRFPASWLFGSMIASGILHGGGWIEGGLPGWVRAVGLIGIGTMIGARFARVRVRSLIGHIAAAIGSFVVAIGVSMLCVVVVALTTQARLSDVLVAFAPGAMDTMMALALTMHVDPIFVGVHHFVRFLFVTIMTPGIVHLLHRPQEDVDD